MTTQRRWKVRDRIRSGWAVLLLIAGCTDAEPAKKADSEVTATVDAAGDGAADTPAQSDTTPSPDDGDGDAATDGGAPLVDIVAGDVGLLDTPDGCKADCKGKVCGSNGCGSVCGFCKSGEFCTPDGSKCQGFCQKQCKDKVCGPDGCGGACGSCDGGKTCSDDGKCYVDTCQGNCTGKQCGDNGCGKSCGSCGVGDFCDADKCKASPCKGIDTLKGACDGDFLLSCSGEGTAALKEVKDCAAPPNLNNLTCGWDATANIYACVVKKCDSSCVSDTGKPMVCGNNSCGKPCGTCPAGWKCDVTACTPVAGASCNSVTFPKEGECSGDTWVYCNGDKLSFVKCLEVGATKCGWDGATGKFACIY